MIIQIINLSSPEVINKCCAKYNIHPEVLSQESLGMELRNIFPGMTEKYLRLFLKRNELFHKFEDPNNGKVDLCIIGSIDMFKTLSKNILFEGNKDLGNKINNVIKQLCRI